MSVRVEREGAVRRVRLDAGKRNALDLEVIRALREALAPESDAPVAILSGRTDGFSVGLDNAVLAGSPRDREALLYEMGALLVEVLRGPTRLVSVCEGHAVAAGAMLLLISDVRIGIEGDHQIGFTEPRMGMTLPALPVLLARQRLARRQLHALTVLGRTVRPDEGVRAGFLDEVHPTSSDVEAAASAAAIELSQLDEAAYQGTLRTVWGSTVEGMARSVEAQRARLDAVR